MDETNELTELEALMRLHADLPRQGPGSDQCTREALSRLPFLKEDAIVLDLGCGPGCSTLILAEAGYKVLALDRQQDFLNELSRRARARGLDHLIETVHGEMAEPPVEPGSIDLIWSEGAIYCIGFDQGLALWQKLLAPGGIIACTELSWLTEERPQEALSFWNENYPAMRSVSENIAAAQGLGYECLSNFTLPQSAWLSEYYDPLQKKIEKLEKSAAEQASIAKAIENMSKEIATYKKHSTSYGYEFFLLQKTTSAC